MGCKPSFQAEGAYTTRASGPKGQAPRFHTAYGPLGVAVKLTEISPDRWSESYQWSAFDGGGSSTPMAGGFVFALMYQDGWGGPSFGPFGRAMNCSCTGPRAPGCWSDRDNLLGLSTGTSCSDCVAGAGTAEAGLHGYALLVVRPAEFPTPLNFTWDADVLPHVVPGYERVRAPVDSR